MESRALIIGGGIAGLSAASYLKRNGFDTEVFELHDRAGGLCTAWTRKGYRFDGCIHWLMGSTPRSNLHEVWKELGAGNLRSIEWDYFTVARLSGGDTFTLYTDPDRLEAEMLRLGPTDGRVIRLITRNVRRVSRIDMPAATDKMPGIEKFDLALHLPAMLPVLTRWLHTPLGAIVDRFRSPKLREAFTLMYGDYLPVFPAAAYFMMLGFMAKRANGYPLGGSAAFADAIEQRYLELGGRVRYGFKVDEILVQDGKAVGVRGRDVRTGEEREIAGNWVISAADGHDTLERLLGGRYRNPAIDRAYAKLHRYPSLLFFSFGLAADYSSLPHSLQFGLDEPVVLEDGELTVDRLSIRFFNFDPSSAPAGKTAACVMLETANDGYWTTLRETDPARYAAVKKEAADRILAALDTRIPGIKAAAEVIDVATPATFIRYTNNWHGSYEGFMPLLGDLGTKVPRTIPGLANFFMVGQWVNPGGGLPPCGIDGRNLAKKLCALEHRPFTPD